jgi:ACT domain-containing protein
MALSEFEIGKIAEIVAGRTGARLDAKTLRHVIDRVTDALRESPANPDIKGVTCEVPRSQPTPEGPASSLQQPRSESPQSRQPLPPDEAMVTDQGGLYEQIEKSEGNRVIIAAFGKDRPGIGAALTGVLAEQNVSIEDISQTLMQEYFSMIMIANMSGTNLDFAALRDKLQATESKLGMKVYVMHEDTFRYMHRI